VGKAEIVKGLVGKLLPFFAMFFILLTSSTFIRELPIIGSFSPLEWLTLIIVGSAGLVVIAEGCTHLHTRGQFNGAIAGAIIIWLIGGWLMFIAIGNFVGLIDIYSDTGEFQAINTFVMLIGTVLLLAMAIWEIFLSRKLIIHAPLSKLN